MAQGLNDAQALKPSHQHGTGGNDLRHGIHPGCPPCR
jgi:hypothetical protein